MLHGQELRRFLIPNIKSYDDVRQLGQAAELLTQDDDKYKDTKAVTGKCRLCGKVGHFAASCPAKGKARSAIQRTNPKPVAEVEYPEDEYHEDYEDHEELEDYEGDLELNQTACGLDAAEKRPAESLDAPQQIKRLRGPGRPAKQSREVRS